MSGVSFEMNRCPFCGSTKIKLDCKHGKVKFDRSDRYEVYTISARCGACHSRGPTTSAYILYARSIYSQESQEILFAAKKKAADLWNYRR